MQRKPSLCRVERRRLAHGPHGLVLASCLLAAGSCGDPAPAEEAPATLPEVTECPESAAFSEYRGDWMLARACDPALGEVTAPPMSKLTDFARGLVASTVDSYLPGPGSLLFGSAGDPFAAQTQQMLTQLHDAKIEINGNTGQVDDAVRRLQGWGKTLPRVTFSSLVERYSSWNRQSYQQKVSSAGAMEIQRLHDELSDVRNVFGHYLLLVSEDDGAQQPYSSVAMLHNYVVLMDLNFDVARARTYWLALHAEYVRDKTRSEQAVRAAAEASDLTRITHEQLAGISMTMMKHATNIAQVLGERDAFLENTKWKAPILATNDELKLGERTPAVQEAGRHTPIQGLLGDSGWLDAGAVEITWYGASLHTFVGPGGDRWCGTKMFTTDEMLTWDDDLKEEQKTVYQFANVQTTDPWKGLFYHGPRPHCAASASSVTPFPQDEPLRDGGRWKTHEGDPNILAAVDAVMSDHARHSREYANMVATGYTPFRLALDKWWRNVRSADPTQPLYRPYTAMDALHDELLWDKTSSVVQALGASAELGAIIDSFSSTTTDPHPLPNQRSKYVGLALQYGGAALLEMINQAENLDPDPSRRDGYPSYLHEVYIDKYVGRGVTAADYYEHHADAEWNTLLAALSSSFGGNL
jgi:hypothetical protein